MNYNHLFYFWNIAKEGSIKAAANRLHLSQPTLSDQLKTFEETLGERLFDRKGRKLILNDNGKIILKYANKIFRISDEMSEAFRNKDSKNARVIKIGFVPTIAKGRIYQILLPFLGHNEFKLNVLEGEYEFIRRAFEMDELDIVICEKPFFGLEKEVVIKKFVASTFFVVCSKKYEKMKNRYPACLADIPFINYTNRSDIQHQIIEFFNRLAIRPNIIGEMDDVNIIRRFTKEGHCFAILPKSVIEEPVEEGKLIILSPLDDIKIAIHAVFRDIPENKIIRKIFEELV